MSELRQIWTTYTESWKVEPEDMKRALFSQSLAPDCQYTDPLVQTRGWDHLLSYMLEFHKQIRGGHFVTLEFHEHHQRSFARWEMRDANDAVLSHGNSFGEYNQQNKLIAMTGFFPPPE